MNIQPDNFEEQFIFPSTEIFSCKFCGEQLYGEATRTVPTERRGWVVYIPHFCCCGRCSWDCPHDHGPLDIVCADVDVNHSPSIICKES